MPDVADSISSLQMRLTIHRRTITYLEEQRARFGPFTPPYVRHQLEETRAEIRQIKQELQALGVVVEDQPGDEAPEPSAGGYVRAMDRDALLLAYQRMLVDQARYISLAGLSDWGELDLQLADVYVERNLLPMSPGVTTSAPLMQLVQEPRARILIEAGPGGGKSALLRHMVLACAAHMVSDPTLAVAPHEQWPEGMPLPILISVYDIANSLGRSDTVPTISVFWSVIEDLLQGNDLGMLVPVLQEALQAGECLILIDGLDDITDPDFFRIITAGLGRFVTRYPQNRYVVTCRQRTTMPQGALIGFAHYALGPLEDGQVDAMVESYAKAIARSVGFPALADLPEQIARLQGHLRTDERMRDLVRQPLALTLCVVVHAEGRRLPQARTVVFQRLLDLLLDRWNQVRMPGSAPALAQLLGVPALALPAQRLALLQPLALAFQRRPDFSDDEPAALHVAEIEPLLREPLLMLGVDYRRAIEEVIPHLLDYCCRQGLLMQTDSAPRYAMPQRALREYLAARALARMPDFPSQAYQLREESRWRETILLAVQELGQGPTAHIAREFLRLLLEAPPYGERPNDLLLAAATLLELGERSGPERMLRAETRERLVELLANPACATSERVRAGQLLGQLGDPRFDEIMPPLVRIGGGPFVLGDRDGYEDEGPVQWVDVPSFAIGAYTVTNREYARFLADEVQHPRPRYWHDPRFNNPSQPVVGVSWHDAVAYCAWLNARLQQTGALPRGMVVRLPLEIEWEKAASWDPKRQVKRRFPWGDAWSAERANTAEGRGAWVTAPVGCYPNGVSAYGVHDMVGNVWEWTASIYQSYPGATHPFHEADSYTLRGSSCVSLPSHTRTTYRSRLPPGHWRYHLGFRIVVARPLHEMAGL